MTEGDVGCTHGKTMDELEGTLYSVEGGKQMEEVNSGHGLGLVENGQ